jgi:large subunit ribosomal protein L22
MMQVTSTYRYARISAFKAREVTREIQGHSASDALDLLAFSPKKAALLVKKTLRSAIANAENNADLRVDNLLVKEAVVGEGPTFKRFRARARGSASPLRKRTSHIRIVLTDELAAKAPVKGAGKNLSKEAEERNLKRKADRAKPATGSESSAPAKTLPEQTATSPAAEPTETNPAAEKE